MIDAYRDGLEFLYGRLNYERVGMPGTPGELRLARMRRLLRRIGDPHQALRIIHVTGTKGKGSTAAMIAAALGACGYRVGLFTSPHLHRVEERFRVGERDATETQMIELLDAVRPIVEAFDREEELRGRRGPTFFEVTTALGLLHFAREKTDFAVIEVGMGGRLDSTNVVRPLVAAITTVSLDHTRQLGTTTTAIAREKAGIIKRRRPVVSGVIEEPPRQVIHAVAAQRQAPLDEPGAGFQYEYEPPPRPRRIPEGGSVRVRTRHRDWGVVRPRLLGSHQGHNAAVALAVLDVLESLGVRIPREPAVAGIEALRLPARVEVVAEAPWVVIDGAHNVASAEALAETLRHCLPPGPRTLVFGTTRDKDAAGQLRALLPLFDRCVATRYLGNPRAVPPEEVAAAVRAVSGQPALVTPGPGEALTQARAVTPRDGLICVTGSMFLAAEAREILLGIEPTPVLVAAASR